ncbi:MAG: hypothetical protein B6I24_04505 [Bacteroidetes bacterium 4572_128]|nr:MAG: hypothetical protein B6I24_04505 [Bacteroidetes bacterium 4572_128]
MRIFLTGFMGCGKTYLGKIIAKKLNYKFIDLDELIEKEQNLSINEIFEKKGEMFFRKLENFFLQKTIKNFKNIVLATGGGTFCFFDNISIINKNGISFYIKTDVKTLIKRLQEEKNKRPLIKNKSKLEMEIFIKKSLKLREKFYLKSHFIFNEKFFNKK